MINFEGCIEPPKEVGKYKEFKIAIEGFYYWGDGYRTHKDYDDFHRLLDKLENDLDSVIQEKYFGKLIFIPSDPNSYECSEIKPVKANYEPSNVYLHPMEFTGILQEEDIERLCVFVNEYSKVLGRPDISANIQYMNDTYHLTDVDYINLILQNSKKIISIVQEQLDKMSARRKAEWFKWEYHEVGFDFAKTCGINRDFGNRHGYSSSDADVATIQTLVKNAIDDGTLK